MVNRPKATPDQIKKMVNNLESFRYIWDVNMQDFFNRQKKQAEWAQLAEIVGLPLADTKRTYETIRKKFRQVSIYRWN